MGIRTRHITLREGEMRPGQRVMTISVKGDVSTLGGPTVEIRFPSGWAKKLLLWADSPARNIMCNADPRRFNLVGVTKVGKNLTLSYVGPDGDLKAETVSRGFLRLLAQLLES